MGTGENLWLIIKESKTTTNMIIGVVYQPPINSKYYEVNLYKNLEHEINKLLKNFPDYDICLMGDFNARTADKDSVDDIRDKNEGFKDILRNRGNRKSKDKVINLEGEKHFRK